MKPSAMFKLEVAFHPGETLEEALQEREMSIKEFAVRSEKPEKTINAVLRGKSSITPEMAIAFERVLLIPAHFWLNKQRLFDEYQARLQQEKNQQDNIKWAKHFPIADMIKRGWIPQVRTWGEKLEALLQFMGMSSPKAWQGYYMGQTLKVAFRISLKNSKNPYAVSVWLRHGDIAMLENHSMVVYNESDFVNSIPKIKQLVRNQPDDFFVKLQLICAQSGVKLVFTPALKGAPINGATRWINGRPLIQMSDRYKQNDIFWFSFFHEVGHILKHGKKDIFVESQDKALTESLTDSDLIKNKEREADRYATEILFPHSAYQEMIQLPLTQTRIEQYAKKYDTHPGIIVGRLHHDKKLPYTCKYGLIKIDLSNE